MDSNWIEIFTSEVTWRRKVFSLLEREKLEAPILTYQPTWGSMHQLLRPSENSTSFLAKKPTINQLFFSFFQSLYVYFLRYSLDRFCFLHKYFYICFIHSHQMSWTHSIPVRKLVQKKPVFNGQSDRKTSFKQVFFGDFPCVTNFVTFIQIYLYVSTNIYNLYVSTNIYNLYVSTNIYNLYVSTNVYNPYLPKHPRNCTNDNHHTGCFF